MNEQNRQKPKIQPLNPSSKRPDTKPSPKPRRKLPRFLVRLAATLVVLAVAVGLVGAVAFRDRLNVDSVKRWFHYRSLIRSDSGRAESFPYGGELTDTFAVLDGDLLVCSRNAISLYSGSGAQYINQSAGMENPVVNTNGSLAVVYDAGGSELYVLGQRSLVWAAEGLESILSARLNKNGQLTVVTQASGYRGTVTGNPAHGRGRVVPGRPGAHRHRPRWPLLRRQLGGQAPAPVYPQRGRFCRRPVGQIPGGQPIGAVGGGQPGPAPYSGAQRTGDVHIRRRTVSGRAHR